VSAYSYSLEIISTAKWNLTDSVISGCWWWVLSYEFVRTESEDRFVSQVLVNRRKRCRENRVRCTPAQRLGVHYDFDTLGIYYNERRIPAQAYWTQAQARKSFWVIILCPSALDITTRRRCRQDLNSINHEERKVYNRSNVFTTLTTYWLFTATFASAVYATANPSVRHTPMLSQNEGIQRDAVLTVA